MYYIALEIKEKQIQEKRVIFNQAFNEQGQSPSNSWTGKAQECLINLSAYTYTKPQ